MLKITYGLIVLNGDFVLRQVLESIYPFAHAICIAEGAVNYWQTQGVDGSTDDTIKILKEFPDPENKIKVVHGVYREKTEQCRDWFSLVPPDTDYVWCIDSDEVFKPEDIHKVIHVLENRKPGSIGFQSVTFFGGFEHRIGGFEIEHSFKRVLKYEKGARYVDHRPPTLNSEDGEAITGKEMFQKYAVEMYHYSYVSPRQVYEKINYYEAAVIKKGNCILNYFYDVFMWWIDHPSERKEIEDKHRGVHEFEPKARGDAFTIHFTGAHPEIIQRDMPELKAKFEEQMKELRLEMWVSNKAEQDLLFDALHHDFRVLEWGSGKSTLAIAKRVKHLVSIEHDPRFYKSTSQMLAENGIDNVTMVYVPTESGNVDSEISEDFVSYIGAPQSFGPFDLAFVDGRARVACADFAARIGTKTIFIHDYKHPKPEYRRYEYEVVEDFLKLEAHAYAMARFTPKAYL